MKDMGEHYSGKRSKVFWKRIGKLREDYDHGALYIAGCILQNVEGYVLAQLHNAEVMQTKAAKGKTV